MALNTAPTYEQMLTECTRCASLLAQKQVDPGTSDEPVKPRPIVRHPTPRPVMLIGQAPGLTEYRSGEPFSGPAGKDIREIFEQCGLDEAKFKQLVFTSVAVKCFPGSKLTKRRRGEGFRREDLKPSAAMLTNCRPFLLAQLELLSPRVVVLLGSLALQVYLEIRTGKCSKPSLAEHVGTVQDWSGRRVIPFAHTSGGSFWLNDAGNRALQARAISLLRQELAELAR